MSDAGTYTLVAENRNGTDKVPMDLIVLDPMNDCDCDMFKSADLECHCSSGFRHGSNYEPTRPTTLEKDALIKYLMWP